jgi:tetratricopeptide (TPR) repeat protein
LLNLSQIWTKVYDPATASADLGLPLRLDIDYNIPSVRSSLKTTYERIILDLQDAITLLPVEALHPSRPSRLAALALLARTYLFMGEYEKCLQYSDQFLKLKSDLLDFNTLSAAATFPLPEFNKEVVFASYMPTPAPLNISRARVDSTLYRSYVNGDLRKTIFFRDNKNGSFGFRGSHMGNLAPYSGVAVDELYLMRAECYARAGNTVAALSDLNTLLKSRWNKSMVFTPLTAPNSGEALKLILTERRKELLMRGLRWSDLKRLNRDGAGIIISRKINSTVYTLPPNDLRYALPFPEDVIALTGMPQNPR